MAGKITFSGKLELTAAPEALEAVLGFEPGPAGGASEIDLAGLKGLLAQKGVREGVSGKDLEAFLLRLKSAKEAFSLVVARGEAPENSSAETALWQISPVPASLVEEAKRTFSKAPPPELYSEKKEQVASEKTVMKKSLPFLPAKAKKVVEIEEKVTRVRIPPPGKAVAYGYAKEGDVLAVLEPLRPGKPGKSVTGAPVPPGMPKFPYVYAGQGVQKQAQGLIAGRQGFVRRGENWVEVLASRGHTWSVSLGSGSGACFLNFTPGEPDAPLPVGEAVRKAALALPYPDKLLLSAGEIEVILKRLLAGGQAQTVSLSLREDASVKIRVSDDRLEALLFLRKGRGGGKQLSCEAILKQVEASGLKGLAIKKITAAVNAFLESVQQSLDGLVLVKGFPAAPPGETAIKWEITHIPRDELEELKKAAVRQPHALEKIQSVKDFPVSLVELAARVRQAEKLLSLEPGPPARAGVDVYGAEIPVPPQAEDALLLRENLERTEDGITSAIDGIFEARTVTAAPGERASSPHTKPRQVVELRVRPHKDGEVNISVSENKMEALLSLVPEEGTGEPLTGEKIHEAVRAASIAEKAIIQEALTQVKEKLKDGADAVHSVKGLLIAKGKLPRDAAPRGLKFFVHIATGSHVKLRGDGKADFKNLDTITSVKKDEVIAEIISERTEAEDGWDVTGGSVPGKSSQDEDFTAGENLHEEKRGGKTLLISEADGEFRSEKGVISVREGYIINGDINLKTGNIKFPGPVIAAGSVEPGFFVFSGGNIRIAGGIEAALLSADGSIEIGQGIKGRGKAVLRAKKNICASFAEQAVLMCGGDINLKTGCIRCTIKCNGKITLPGEKGSLIGGIVKARYGIEAASIGTESGVHTEIHFGQDYLLEDQIEKGEKTLKKLTEAAAAIALALHAAEKNGETAKIANLQAEKLANAQQTEKLTQNLMSLRENFEKHYPSEIRVHGIIYPGVVIGSQGKYYEIRGSNKQHLRLVYDKEAGKIVEHPL
ncbi:MAG: FapA family protein [Spirochaetales bacterium]|jgi:uncharacterized protein (DUF342 family)|nr:FapA family protein [Spirochaetales bacterium]